MEVYVTRDSFEDEVDVWPATVGIRKFHSCIEWGAAWQSQWRTFRLYPKRGGWPESLNKHECRKRFGFYPRKGTAWFVKGKKRTEVDIDFSG